MRDQQVHLSQRALEELVPSMPPSQWEPMAEVGGLLGVQTVLPGAGQGQRARAARAASLRQLLEAEAWCYF